MVGLDAVGVVSNVWTIIRYARLVCRDVRCVAVNGVILRGVCCLNCSYIITISCNVCRVDIYWCILTCIGSVDGANIGAISRYAICIWANVWLIGWNIGCICCNYRRIAGYVRRVGCDWWILCCIFSFNADDVITVGRNRCRIGANGVCITSNVTAVGRYWASIRGYIRTVACNTCCVIACGGVNIRFGGSMIITSGRLHTECSEYGGVVWSAGADL